MDVPIFCLRNFKSSEVVENWKFLSQQIEDEQIAKKFSLVLNKMEKSKTINPLEMVIQLGKVGKYPDVMKFIIEHEKPYSTVSLSRLFFSAFFEPASSSPIGNRILYSNH